MPAGQKAAPPKWGRSLDVPISGIRLSDWLHREAAREIRQPGLLQDGLPSWPNNKSLELT
jgi:hypothetical protein